MTSEQYMAWTAGIRNSPAKVQVLIEVNRWLTYLGYLLYPALVVYSIVSAPEILARIIVVPGVMFVLVSAFRSAFNAPRPYEKLDIEPLIHKDTKGKSFPSRHIFSMAMISMCYLYVNVPMGCVLWVCTLVMAVIRVFGGVHFPKDVIAGALIAAVSALIGLWVIPWA